MKTLITLLLLLISSYAVSQTYTIEKRVYIEVVCGVEKPQWEKYIITNCGLDTLKVIHKSSKGDYPILIYPREEYTTAKYNINFLKLEIIVK